ncbi:hypothetical protein JB92DRAFT_3110833 [Gautieria morchelliformis]|nr:hypothetical protein JB92DRAFT_3110833 [Gautieria morchelliformis]
MTQFNEFSPPFLDVDSKAAAIVATDMNCPSGPLFPKSLCEHALANTVLPAEPPHLILGGVHKSMHDLEIESYAVRDDMRGKWQTYMQTEQTYARYVSDPDYAAVPAFPILASKVVLLLNYETTWKQFKCGSNGETKQRTSVGKHVIKSAISTLKNHRKLNQHLYTNIPGSQIRLPDDIQIQEIEQATAHNEPDHHRKSQTLKVTGFHKTLILMKILRQSPMSV